MSGDDHALAAQLAEDAGKVLLELRGNATPGMNLRAEGDLRSNEYLLDQLAQHRPHDAVLSEESADDLARLDAERVWIIDPLDGTREFALPGRTDWAVHVALWERGKEITAAAVALPSLGTVYRTDDPPPEPAGQGLRILISDSRPPAFAEAVAADLGGELQPMGSAGAKAMAVLRGDAEAYIHAGGQYEWDSAAPVGVVLAGGLHASRIDGSQLRYNQSQPYLPDLVICRRDLAPKLLDAIRRYPG